MLRKQTPLLQKWGATKSAHTGKPALPDTSGAVAMNQRPKMAPATTTLCQKNLPNEHG